MEEITLLDALHQLWHFKAKKKALMFEVTFDEGVTRKAYFGKVWSGVTKDWQYIVQDGERAPGFVIMRKLPYPRLWKSVVCTCTEQP